jgi:hypothetical protein
VNRAFSWAEAADGKLLQNLLPRPRAYQARDFVFTRSAVDWLAESDLMDGQPRSTRGNWRAVAIAVTA